MIYHHNRIQFKQGVSEQDRERALESLRHQGRTIPAVKHFVVGADTDEEYTHGAVFAVEDLQGFWDYLVHPAHLSTDRVGLPLVEVFTSYDTSDEDVPDIAEKIAALHQRRFDEMADVCDLVASLPTYSGPAAPQLAR